MENEQFDWENAVLDQGPEGVVYSNGGHRVEVPAQPQQLPRGAGVAGRTVVATAVVGPRAVAQ